MCLIIFIFRIGYGSSQKIKTPRILPQGSAIEAIRNIHLVN